ncbi:HTTM domain-containing protein [Streptomyces achromogenes]|uniref:HTTM domain-containing protein n=1 Tax=Streptomyces achromogenes TaxID=67255 RepID=UPI0036FAE594
MTAYPSVPPGRPLGPPGPAPLPRGFATAVRRGLARIAAEPFAPYQAAVLRIGLALTWLALLLREGVDRAELYGPDGSWSWDMSRQWNATTHAFTALLWHDGRLWFEAVYVAAVAASVMLLLGWRTRTASLLFMIAVMAVQNRNPFVGNGGDNLLHVMAVYLVFTRCGAVWSLDARRAARGRDHGPDTAGIVLWACFAAVLALVTALGRLGAGWASLLWGFLAAQLAGWLVRRRAPGEPRTVLTMAGNVVHAGAMLVIAVQICLIYSSSGWYKIQGSLWQDGTALYYALHIGNVTPWPALSRAVASHGLVVLLLTYGTVIAEVAFPFLLFNRRTRTAIVMVMMGLHAGIGTLLGLPFFSLAMIAADAVFLPASVLRRLGDRMTRAARRTRTALLRPSRAPAR